MRSFSLVDHKVAEAEFFLRKIPECGPDLFGVRCFVAAFVASARTITYSLQATLRDLPGFSTWYEGHQNELRHDPLARFFHAFRVANHHIGDNAVSAGGQGASGHMRYWFLPTQELSVVPEDDVESACQRHFTTMLQLVFDCYQTFGPHIDAQQRYTPAFFASIGKTIEDAELELGFPAKWTDIGDPAAIAHRWQALRDSSSGVEINHLFHRYLAKTVSAPPRLPGYDRNANAG